MENRLLPLNLQFFAEEAQAAEATPPSQEITQQAAQPTPATAQTASPTVNVESLAAALLKASETRTQRAENNLLKDMAQQHGMSEGELKAILDAAKAEKAKALSPEAQKQLDSRLEAINQRTITAEFKIQGAAAELGLVDVDAALKLADMSGVKVDDEGNVTGVKEALAALKESKPYLFTAAGQASTPLTTQMSHQSAHHEDEFQKRIDKYRKK